MTQKEKVKKTLLLGPRSIQEIAEETGILRPNIRRILGTGAKLNEFERLAPGVYTVCIEDKQVAYIECGAAELSLPEMQRQGMKFDMVFLDPAYYTKALMNSGNKRPIRYDILYPREFAICAEAAAAMLRADDSHLYLMLSGAKGAYKDMLPYIQPLMMMGMRLVGEGEYHKLYSNGNKVLNIRGQENAPERVLLFTRSGQCRPGEVPVILKHYHTRPNYRTSYSTEKPAPFIEQIVKQSTLEGDFVLDPFAGSGVMGEVCFYMKRLCYLLEKSAATVSNYILPRLTF